MEAVEAVRARYRPKQIKTLFVGESPPHSGDFFYCPPNAMLSHMQQAVEGALGGNGDFLVATRIESQRKFLERFKAYGWYLDDLVLTPVNQLTKAQCKAKCLEARECLAERIRKYQPEAIVSLLLSIKPFVDKAADMAGSNAPRYAVPFPGMGHQGCFQAIMTCIIPKLPRFTEPV